MISRIAQVIAFVLALMVVLYGLAAAYAVAFPSGSGEWTARVILAVYLVNIPIGVFSLTLALAVKQGSPRLRQFCLAAASTALTLPFLVSIIGWIRDGLRLWLLRS
jgi:hypothetical protein